jgi:hypothetical protein
MTQCVVVLAVVIVALVIGLIIAVSQKASPYSYEQDKFREEMRNRVRCFDRTLERIEDHLRTVRALGVDEKEAQKVKDARMLLLEEIAQVQNEEDAAKTKLFVEAYILLQDSENSES